MSADFLDHLIALGVPIFVAPPVLPYVKPVEFTRPRGWQKLSVAGNAARIASWRPGDALQGVMGGNVAVVDVDPQNRGNVEKVRALLDALGVKVFAEVETPGGGRHFYVAGHDDLATCHELDNYPGVDVQSSGANVFLPGTQRPKYGGRGYTIVSDTLEALADGGDPLGAVTFANWVADNRPGSGETFTPSAPWDGTPPDQRQTAYLASVLRNQAAEVAEAAPGTRNHRLFIAALKCGNFVAGAGMDEQQVVKQLTEAATRCGLEPREIRATIASGLKTGKKKPRDVPPRQDPMSDSSRGADRPHGERARQLLGDLLGGLRQWQHLPDPTHVVVALAVAATRDAEGEPCWVLMVAPPSSGKTEAVRVLDDAADARLDEVTAAGLLGWSKGKDVHPTGVLTRVGNRALVTFGDLSSLLATSDRGGRDQVFALLRRAYDGAVVRDVQPQGGRTTSVERLEWSGRLTVVACVTQTIDRYAAHSDALGPRWVYVRIPERDTEAKRLAAKLNRQGGLGERRKTARETAKAVLQAASAIEDALPDEVANSVEDAALVAAWGRSSVPRNGYGRREIEGMPITEEPMRLVHQLSTIARGVLALGLPAEAATAIARRVALDSMPEARRAVLKALSTGALLSTAGCAREARVDRKVTKMTLEELAAVGVVENDQVNEEDEESRGTINWSLAGEDGDLIADVFAAHHRSGGWDEMWVYTSTSPPERGDPEGEAGVNPTLRPTPGRRTSRTSWPSSDGDDPTADPTDEPFAAIVAELGVHPCCGRLICDCEVAS